MVNANAIIKSTISVTHLKGFGNDALTAIVTPLAIGPTINKLKTLTIPNKQLMRTIIERMIQKRPVPPSPKES